MNGNKKPLTFTKKLVKVGNSLCIRVPKNATDYLELDEGNVAKITIERPVEESVPKKFLLPYKKHFKELSDFSLSDISSCLFFFSIENSMTEDVIGDELRKTIEKFRGNLEKEKGKEFLKKYDIFKGAIKNKEAMKKVIEDTMKVSQELKESMKISMGKDNFQKLKKELK